MSRIFTVEVNCCLDCPAYQDSDNWCELSNKPIPPTSDVLKEVAVFCELEINDV